MTDRVRASSGVSRAELLASLSLAVDLGLGQPMEHVLRQTLVALRLAEHAGFDDRTREDAYYVSLLAWVGCTADSADLARLFGDDLRIRADSYRIDTTGLPLLSFMVRNAGAGASPLRRLGLIAEVVTTKVVERSFTAHCDSAAHAARSFGFESGIVDSFGQLFERWDGKGMPHRLRGDEIAPAVRLLHLADIVEVFDRLGGPAAAATVARDRRATLFDPMLTDCFLEHHASILDTRGENTWDTVIRNDPALGHVLTDDELDDALAVLGDYADLKSPTRAGHSRGVAELAADAASRMGLPDDVVGLVRRTGFVHDLGVIGISNAVWDHAGPFSAADRERVRTHPYLTQRTLSRVPGLAPLAHLAAMHHERQDGSGYPTGLKGDAIPLPARVLAAGDVYRALREPRPHRPALPADDAATVVRDEVRSGRLDSEAANAVLGAAGHHARRRPSGPAGLTPREVEVLVHLARGARNREIAEALDIAPKTVSAHLERIYLKVGVTSRAGATLFAMRHGLLSVDQADP
jgi:HD-GYP domain-containing protein (c-di-GMP phosphodiesterase class II)